MRKRPPGSLKTAYPFQDQIPAIAVADLARRIPEFLYECEYRGHSPRTLTEERSVLEKFLRHLQESQVQQCDGGTIRQYLTHVAQGGLQREGRWSQNAPRPVRPRTVRNHWSYLRTFFNWLQEEDPSFVSPFERIKPPIVRSDQIRPFTEEQIQALRCVARRTDNPLRDEAIVLFLLDSGVRASELCAIRIRDLDLGGHRCIVLGKGNKHRLVYFGRATKKALWRYLQDRHIQDEEPLFISARGQMAGDPLTRFGLLQLIERLGKSAALHGVRCSPHTFRHTAAIRFLKEGGNVFSLQQLLGHTDLTMTQRYLHLAEADLEVQARRYSPVDALTVIAKTARRWRYRQISVSWKKMLKKFLTYLARRNEIEQIIIPV